MTTNNTKTLNNNDDIMTQMLTSIVFITELNKSNFLKSDYYKNMNFDVNEFKPILEKIQIGNQGMLLFFLYGLLAFPKESIYQQYESEYNSLNLMIDKFKKNISFSHNKYKRGKPIEYIRHIRNALSHSSVIYTNDSIIFKDNFKKNVFSVEILKKDIGIILQELHKIIYEHIRNLRNQK